MAGIEGALTTIAACGGIGAFIDFWIGKRGQRRVRDWLETWWLRFSYVNLKNFGREEARFAIATMDKVLGRGFFSRKRFVSFAILEAFDAIRSRFDLLMQQVLTVAVIAATLITVLGFFLLFSSSISLTRYASVRAIRLANRWPSLTGIAFITLLVSQYILMVAWSWFNSWDPLQDNYEHHFSLIPDISSQDATWIFTNGGRFALAALFVASYLLKPLHEAISLLWARVVESDKPIFTLLFGGAAAAAKAVEWAIHAL
jgi:hypothetical protein